jgi:hypothetical protein
MLFTHLRRFPPSGLEIFRLKFGKNYHLLHACYIWRLSRSPWYSNHDLWHAANFFIKYISSEFLMAMVSKRSIFCDKMFLVACFMVQLTHLWRRRRHVPPNRRLSPNYKALYPRRHNSSLYYVIFSIISPDIILCCLFTNDHNLFSSLR